MERAGEPKVGGMYARPVAVDEYLRRALIAFGTARYPEHPPVVRTNMLALCLHACCSLHEALEATFGEDEEMKARVAALPHRALLKRVRDHDIHGHPLPVCEPNTSCALLYAGKKPIRFESSNRVEVSIQLGRKPLVRTSPKSPKHARAIMGDAVIMRCAKGELYVQDPSCSKGSLHLMTLMSAYLGTAKVLLSEAMGATAEGGLG